jgi:hypothetical protein
MAKSPQRKGHGWHGTKFGAQSGIILGCTYAILLGAVLIFSPTPYPIDVFERIVFWGWFSLWGCIVGSIIGLIIGSLTGYLLSNLLAFLVPRVTPHAWLVGLATCTGLWLIVYFTLGLELLSIIKDKPFPEEDILIYRSFVAYPGTIYIISGAWLAHRFNVWRKSE